MLIRQRTLETKPKKIKNNRWTLEVKTCKAWRLKTSVRLKPRNQSSDTISLAFWTASHKDNGTECGGLENRGDLVIRKLVSKGAGRDWDQSEKSWLKSRMDSQSGSFEKMTATKFFDEKLDDIRMDSPSESSERIKVTTFDTESFDKLQLKSDNFDKLQHRDDYHQTCFVDQSKEHQKEEMCVKRFTTPTCTRFVGWQKFVSKSIQHQLCARLLLPRLRLSQTRLKHRSQKERRRLSPWAKRRKRKRLKLQTRLKSVARSYQGEKLRKDVVWSTWSSTPSREPSSLIPEEHDDCTTRWFPASFVSSLGFPQVHRPAQRRNQKKKHITTIQKEIQRTVGLHLEVVFGPCL